MFQDGLYYQESRMATDEEFKEDLLSFNISDMSSIEKGGPVLFREGNMAFLDPSESHSLILGDTGSMKTLRFVLPLIYSAARADESLVVIDPKGELSKKTAHYLSKQGYSTHIINLRNPKDTEDKWNPFYRVNEAYYNYCEYGEDTKDKAFFLLNDLLNQLFYTRAAAEKDAYWSESAGQLALGLCGLLLWKKGEVTVKQLLQWRYKQLMDGTVRDLYNKLPATSPIYQNLAVYLDLTAENTKSCILSVFDQLLRLFKVSPALIEMLSESTFDIDEIYTKKTAIFLVVPDEKTTFHFIASLFISQCYESLLEMSEYYDGNYPRRVNFILEEFCNIPKIEDLVPMLTAARSRNIRFHLVIQSYSQMVDKYGENVSKTVLDNCGNLIYLHSREFSFLSYISQLAGNNEYGRPLLSTSRLQHLKKNETIIFHDRCYPFVTQDIPLIFEYPINLKVEENDAKKIYIDDNNELFAIELIDELDLAE